MKILFVCKHNRFRSKVAEAFFNKLNKNKNYKAESAGIFKGFPVSDSVISVGKKLGIRINKNTQGLREEFLSEYDIIIIVANNVPRKIFDDKRRKRKVILWKIPDTNQNNKEQISKISQQIGKKVKDFVKELK